MKLFRRFFYSVDPKKEEGFTPLEVARPKALRVRFARARFLTGFTLIEMLVVIAVIGVLSSVLLTALGPARDKAKDSRIVQEVNQVRSIAETLYDGDYDALEELAIDGNPADILNPEIRIVAVDIAAQGGGLVIVKPEKPATIFVAYSKLTSKIGPPEAPVVNYYCVDSSGKAGFTTEPETNINTGKISCPF